MLALPAKATVVEELIVEYSSDGGSSWHSFSATIFNETNFLPGQDVARLIRVTNNSEPTQRIAMEAINYAGFPNPNNVPSDDLSRALLIVIKQGATDIFGGLAGSKTLFDFYKNGETYLSDLAGGATIQYDIIISFPSDTGNDWQSKITTKTTKFDILVGFEGTEGGLTPLGPGEGMGTIIGVGGGLPPGLTIQSETVPYIGVTSVIITWTTSYLSTSEVIYDTVPGKFSLSAGEPKYGYAFIKSGDDSGQLKVVGHSVTITGLTSSVTYYFRAVSHASLAISQEHSFTTLATKEGIGQGGSPEEEISGLSEGAGAGVTGQANLSQSGAPKIAEEEEIKTLAEAAQGVSAETEKKEGQIETETSTIGLFGNFFAAIGAMGWKGWLILLIIVLVILVLLFILRKRSKEKESGKQIS